MLKRGVGSDSGPVQHVVDGRTGKASAVTQCCHPLGNTDRRVLRFGRDLVDDDRPRFGVGEHQVGESAANVDPASLIRSASRAPAALRSRLHIPVPRDTAREICRHLLERGETHAWLRHHVADQTLEHD